MDVLRIPGKNWFIQFQHSRGWGCATQDGPLWFAERRNFIPLLPLLEQPWPEADALVISASQAKQVEAEFPFEQVIQEALAWPTEGWPGLALAWFAQGFPVSVASRQKLVDLANNKAMSQRLRHQAVALSKAGGASEA
jgi:hypothetical protein